VYRVQDKEDEMTRRTLLALLAQGVSLVGPACAQPSWARPSVTGRLLSVSVEVEGRETPLYPARDGSGRFYLEAKEGARYALTLTNRTRRRLAAVVTVDGLNVITGNQETGGGRMYVLDPWETTTIRGWRTSLSEVRRFTFVDERTSYATRSGQASGKMGWIEVAVYRERRPVYPAPACCDEAPGSRPDTLLREESRSDGRDAQAVPAAPGAAGSPEAGNEAKDAARTLGAPITPSERRPSYPGTGWGAQTSDPVSVVSFDPETRPAECLTLRYEYASALRALGIPLLPEWNADRLHQRERGDLGFAKPPAW
jgi:hypothetical protein